MRTIKYRAWIELDNGCAEDDPAYYTEKLMMDVCHLGIDDTDVVDVTIQDDYFRGGEMIEYPIREVELMQFTGLKDVNGREIYEGDIVLFGDNAVHGGTHGKVIWHESRLGFVYEFIDGEYKGKCTDMMDTWRTYKVIGSVYENPELLK